MTELDDVQAIDDAARVMQIFFKPRPAPLPPPQPAPVERARRRRPRKPTIDKLIAKAKAAGATSVVVEMRFGPGKVEQANDLDKWMAKRHAH